LAFFGAADQDGAADGGAQGRGPGALGWRFAAGPRNEEAFTPPNGGVVRMNQMLKRSLDPQGIFNPGKMFALDEVRK
tara:strand:- start:265 stop:495 length:231 start_codon:yes stop_codon:yes gene_type:complete